MVPEKKTGKASPAFSSISTQVATNDGDGDKILLDLDSVGFDQLREIDIDEFYNELHNKKTRKRKAERKEVHQHLDNRSKRISKMIIQ